MYSTRRPASSTGWNSYGRARNPCLWFSSVKARPVVIPTRTRRGNATMQIKTERGLVNMGGKTRPIMRVALTPNASSGHLVMGIAIGLVFGFALGSVVALSVGDRSLMLAQHLWSRLFSMDQEGERVHFEWLLQ